MSNLEDGVAAFESGDYGKAFSILEPLAAKGICEAQSLLGCIYQYGLGQEINGKEAIYWHTLASDQGYGPSSDNLGTIYFGALPDIPPDPDKSKKYYLLAKSQGFVF